MSDDLKNVKLVTAEVVRMGSAIVVPDGMELKQAAHVLVKRAEYEETNVSVRFVFDADVYSTAYALGKAIEEVCGTLMGKTTYSMFGGERPPAVLTIERRPGQFVSMPWGNVQFPLDENSELIIHYSEEADGIKGALYGTVKKKHEGIAIRIAERARQLIVEEPLFKGCTLRIQFTDSDGDMLNVMHVKPWNVKNASTAKLIFSEELEASITDHILTPIRYFTECKRAGIPFKRGVLLAGTYGTGKTELAAAVAREASERGMTVIYIENVKELPHALRLAAQLAPSIVFAEDVDRVATGGRTHEIDSLLNTLDGIDTKKMDVMTIFTTNYPDKVYKGMIRPGRVDVALEIGAPDAGAALRLVKAYVGENFDATGDIIALGDLLAGMIPAVIREICERAKLSVISRTGNLLGENINVEDVTRAAHSMHNQIQMLNGPVAPAAPELSIHLSPEKFLKAGHQLKQ